MAKQAKSLPALTLAVRTRRAYFDCQFGQLHVRTAFPTTGGFDEQVTLFCLHSATSASRTFARFLPEIADVRSVYAPDLPGYGESDSSPHGNAVEAAGAVADLAGDLRLRQIDLLGFQRGAIVALELAAARPDLVRRLVLISVPIDQPLPSATQESFVLRTRSEAAGGAPRIRSAVPNATIVDADDYTDDLFDAAPKTLARQISSFLSGRPA